MNTFVSIIIPLFNEEENIFPLVHAIQQAMAGQGDYEILLIDDGSRDGTYGCIQQVSKENAKVRGIRFRRNCGQTAALKAGFDNAKGDICITMDGDLQHDPSVIPKFLAKMNEGYDLVCSYRQDRHDSFSRRFPSKVANWLARLVSRLQLRDFGSTYRAYRTELAKNMPIFGEMHRFIPVFIGMQTDNITEISITVQKRKTGCSSYGLGRTFRVFSDLWVLLFFAGFFSRPIHIFGYIALALGGPGIAILGWLGWGKIMGTLAIGDYGPLFILGVLLLLLSMQMFTTGIVCEYLVRIYYGPTNNMPYSIAETTDSD